MLIFMLFIIFFCQEVTFPNFPRHSECSDEDKCEWRLQLEGNVKISRKSSESELYIIILYIGWLRLHRGHMKEMSVVLRSPSFLLEVVEVEG